MGNITRNIVLFCAALLLVLSAVGCSREKTIPDETLSDIFHDMYISNAYADEEMRGVNFDSINIYEPIIAQYGYSQQDFINTIGGFSKRKSARLSQIVEAANDKLDLTYAAVNARVAALDRRDSIALHLTKRVVYTDSTIKVRRVADTSRLRIALPASEGEYEISYNYLIDSTEQNRNLINRFFVRNSRGTGLASASDRMRTRTPGQYRGRIKSPPGGDTLLIVFANYPRDMQRQVSLTIDSLVVTHYLPREEALMKTLRTFLDYRLNIDGKEYDQYIRPPQDSLSLHILPPLIMPARDSIPG